MRTYGTECAAIFNLVRERRELAAPLAAGHPAIEAEVIHIARRELAQRVDDVLVRRIHLYYEAPEHGLAAAQRTAELLAEELGWGAAQVDEEVERYRNLVAWEQTALSGTDPEPRP